MKITHILAAGAVALACVGMASAQEVITITGSSAYRGSVHKAIINILGGSVTGSTATLPANGGTGGFAYAHANDFTKANSATFRGYLGGDSSKEVIIKTSWTGSGAGIQTVASTNSSFTVRVLPTAAVLSPSGTAGLNDPTSSSATPTDYSEVLPDIALADNKQTATLFVGTFNGELYTDLTAVQVGVVPFVWVKSKGAAAGITNVTPQIARALWKGAGRIPLSFFTGNSGDSTSFVYSTGRDGDSGTRINAFAEGGIGINSGVQQYDCATEDLYFKTEGGETVNGIFYEVGQGGEKSGGTLAGNAKMGKDNLTKSYVSYMSTGDASTLVGLGGAVLTYNGVTYSDAAVEQGLYTFWGYEWLLYKPSLGGLKLTTATALANRIIGADATLKLSDMKVKRTTEGGTVTQ